MEKQQAGELNGFLPKEAFPCRKQLLILLPAINSVAWVLYLTCNFALRWPCTKHFLAFPGAKITEKRTLCGGLWDLLWELWPEHRESGKQAKP